MAASQPTTDARAFARSLVFIITHTFQCSVTDMRALRHHTLGRASLDVTPLAWLSSPSPIDEAARDHHQAELPCYVTRRGLELVMYV